VEEVERKRMKGEGGRMPQNLPEIARAGNGAELTLAEGGFDREWRGIPARHRFSDISLP
jgi:hypothetical protein